MQQKREFIDVLIEMARKGYNIAQVVGADIALRIKEIIALEEIDQVERYIQQLVDDWQIDEEEIALKKTFKEMDVDEELYQMKKDLGL
ncbi:MAG: hypothetical protein ACFB0B_01820 [Thermonemataceae bacterium]